VWAWCFSRFCGDFAQILILRVTFLRTPVDHHNSPAMSCVRVAAIATLAAYAAAAPAADKVTSLPGYGAPPTDTYSGERCILAS
jgi:hypothetical protein